LQCVLCVFPVAEQRKGGAIQPHPVAGEEGELLARAVEGDLDALSTLFARLLRRCFVNGSVRSLCVRGHKLQRSRRSRLSRPFYRPCWEIRLSCMHESHVCPAFTVFPGHS
jgi:hypothetical protein